MQVPQPASTMPQRREGAFSFRHRIQFDKLYTHPTIVILCTLTYGAGNFAMLELFTNSRNRSLDIRICAKPTLGVLTDVITTTAIQGALARCLCGIQCHSDKLY